MPESVQLTFTLEQDGQGYWRAFVRGPGLGPYFLTAAFLTKEACFDALVERLARAILPME